MASPENDDWDTFVESDFQVGSLSDTLSLDLSPTLEPAAAVGPPPAKDVPVGSSPPTEVRLGVIGLGAVTAFHHIPGILLTAGCKLVTVCDCDEELLRKRCAEWNPTFGQLKASTNYMDVVNDPAVDAVVVATPNHSHFKIVSACLAQKKHVMCEKPLGVNAIEATEMHRLAVQAGVRHMTAFTYRFAPALRYLAHLTRQGSLGAIRHFRSQRFLDWPETSWGWRQYKVWAPDPFKLPACYPALIPADVTLPCPVDCRGWEYI